LLKQKIDRIFCIFSSYISYLNEKHKQLTALTQTIWTVNRILFTPVHWRHCLQDQISSCFNQLPFFHLTFSIVISVNWLKRTTYDKRITLIYKPFSGIIVVICERSSHDNSQTPYWKWFVGKNKLTHVWSQSHSICWNWLQNLETGWWIFFVNWMKWRHLPLLEA
jgi:hypothetical protein